MPDTRIHLEQLLWAMHPSFLAIVTEKMERLSWDEPKEKPTDPPPSILVVADGVGTIPVEGTLMSENHWLFGWIGDTSYEAIQRAAKEAGDRADVQAVLIRTNSGGGLAHGMDETAEAIRQLGYAKPLLAYNENQMSSAAYGLNMHATHIVSAPGAFSGSIGSAMIHREISGLEKKIGIKTTDFASGDLKRIASAYEPLTPEARTYLEGLTKEHGKVFVEQTSAARKLTPAQATEVARAGEFVGAQAVSIGLVDSLGLSSHVRHMLNLYKEKHPSTFVDLGRTTQGGATMATPEELKAAQQAERKRIADIKALAPAGMEAFAESLAFSDEGLTVEQAAVRILAEQKANPPKPPIVTPPAVPATPPANPLAQFANEAPNPVNVTRTDPVIDPKAAEATFWDTAYTTAVEQQNKSNVRGSLNQVRI